MFNNKNNLKNYGNLGIEYQTCFKIIRTSPQQIIEKFDYADIQVATWNVRGCANIEKQELIDRQLNNLNITITGIQETHMTSGTFESDHF